MKNKATAVVDIDGVLANFESAACDAFGYENRHLYKLEKRYPHLHPDLIAEWVNSEDNYYNLSPIFGGILLIQQLQQRGFTILLMTSRGEHLRSVTLGWLRVYNIPYNYCLFQHNKAEQIKSLTEFDERMAIKNPITLFIDDSVSQLEQVKELNPSVACLAWAQPWNEGYFPRLRYNMSNYKIEANVGMGEWKWMWSK